MGTIAKRPLTVYVVWHPDDADAAGHATMLLKALHADPGNMWAERMGIPVKFRSSVSKRDLPLPIDIDESDASVTVILWGDAMGADRGNVWRPWLARFLIEHGPTDGRHRVVNAALTPSALGDATTFGNLNLTRLFTDPSERHSHELLIAVLRTIALALKSEPVKVFISHAKVDASIAKELRARVLEARLDKFFDADDIDDGTSAFETINDQLENSATVAILTDAFPSRSWCRLEVVESRRKARPLVVVDALDRGCVRMVPHLDHVPIVHRGADTGVAWDNTLEHLLREVVRFRYFPNLVERYRNGHANTVSLPRAPDLLSTLSIAGTGIPTTIVYPDPPLGSTERDVLGKASPGLTMLTVTEWRVDR